MTELPHVVIVGAGFAGLYAARELGGAPVRVTVIDRRNHHLFQPLLYQVATAALAAPDIAEPIRRILRRHENTTVLLGDVSQIDTAASEVVFREGTTVGYDYLLVATGATHAYFGHDEWAAHAPGLKSVEDAFEIRRRVLLAFEAAERETDSAAQEEWLTFVIVGAGPTGVELAGALREIATRTLTRDFRRFDSRRTRVVLVDGEDRVLGSFPEKCSRDARELLEARGVEIRTGAFATHIDDRGVTLGEERIAARTVLWAAGVRASGLGASLDAERDRQGRVLVAPDLSVPGLPNVFVAGDLAAVRNADGSAVPGMAPAAIQEGRHVARTILDRIASRESRPFRYRDKGMLATVGRSAAVAAIGRFRFSGMFAWLLWLFVHVLYLIGFRNRVAVLLEWSWAYLTFQRSARVIIDRGDGGR